MKLRIQGNSLRLRLGPKEIDHLIETGRVEESICFGSEENARLTYALELADDAPPLSLRYRLGEVALVLSQREARAWAESDQVGIAASSGSGPSHLALLVEKDFACLDDTGRENEDTFPNPKTGAAC